MKNVSVYVNNVSNNERFLKNFYYEISNEISADLLNNKVLVYNVDIINFDILYNILAQKVLDEFVSKVIIRILNKNCNYFSKKDRYTIYKNVMTQISDDKEENNYDHQFRLNIVKNEIKKLLSETDSFYVEGFVNFRLKELEQELEDLVEECVQEYLLELEYMEFINMIRYFLSFQESKYLVCDVTYDTKITLYSNGVDITDECIRDFDESLLFWEINKDDFLLNSLITIAPKLINLNEKIPLGEEIKKTLLGVFGDKIKITKTE